MASALAVPLLTFLSPSWFSLMGVGPSWSVLWLLPWALVNGPNSGSLAGFSLGLILDAISIGDGTHVPVLILLGFWWGRIGRRDLLIDSNFSLGCLAWIGSVVLGISFWIQFSLTHIGRQEVLFNSWSLHTILCQAILTGLLAPLACTWLLTLFKGPKSTFISK
nr:rod shape-determining protein MreD [Prochlorococcus sp. MIT 1307]